MGVYFDQNTSNWLSDESRIYEGSSSTYPKYITFIYFHYIRARREGKIRHTGVALHIYIDIYDQPSVKIFKTSKNYIYDQPSLAVVFIFSL